MENNSDSVRWAFSIVVPAIAGFVGVLIGAWLAARREVSERRYAFVEKQLRDFYSPLLGIRNEILMKSQLRVKVHAAADAVWQGLAAGARSLGDPDALLRLERERWPEFERCIAYSEEQLANAIVPSYRAMVNLFRDNLWLAEPETRLHFEALAEFVEIWERSLGKSIPKDVVGKLGHTEQPLKPFYDHLQEMLDVLRGRLAKGNG
jgi:hypothetical protein